MKIERRALIVLVNYVYYVSNFLTYKVFIIFHISKLMNVTDFFLSFHLPVLYILYSNLSIDLFDHVF